jgi:RNA polymerase-interacting CarD/CdnL/TRCF family regulator
VAEVVRDLTHAQINKGISPALKRMLAKARTTLASEIACALKVDEETAIEKINQHLPEEDPEDGL